MATTSTWSVSLSANPTVARVGATVHLTAQSNQDVGPTPYYILIRLGNTTYASCGSGTSCATDLVCNCTADFSFYALVAYSDASGAVARSADVPVTWSNAVASEISYWLSHISQRWGEVHNGSTEYGADFTMNVDTPIYAVESGPVLGAGYYGGGGVISIQTASTISEYYQHLDCIYVSQGQHVNAGDLIGTSGGNINGGSLCGHLSSTTYSTGPHIEWGINAPFGGMWHPLGANQDPVPYLQALTGN